MADRGKLISFTRADEIDLRATQWLIDGWLVRDTLAGMVGPSGSCKSFLGIDWACRVATGTPWFGRNVEQGAVFVIAGEGRSGMRKRIDGWQKATGIPIAGAPLYIADCLPPLADLGNAAEVMNEISDVAEALFYRSGCEPTLIIIDTVARALAGANENSSDDMGRLIQGMDWLRQQWGACVLSLHHTGHGTETQSRARGSSAYYAALDSEFVLKATDQAVEVKVTKGKDWASPLPLTLTKEVIEVDVPTAQGISRESTLVLRDQFGAVVEANRQRNVIALHREGKSERDISEETGVPKSTVHRWIVNAKPVWDEAFSDD